MGILIKLGLTAFVIAFLAGFAATVILRANRKKKTKNKGFGEFDKHQTLKANEQYLEGSAPLSRSYREFKQ